MSIKWSNFGQMKGSRIRGPFYLQKILEFCEGYGENELVDIAWFPRSHTLICSDIVRLC